MEMLERIDQLDQEIRLAASVSFAEMSLVIWACSIYLPTLLHQVRDDRMTRPEDGQAMFNKIPIPEKDLLWIDGTSGSR